MGTMAGRSRAPAPMVGASFMVLALTLAMVIGGCVGGSEDASTPGTTAPVESTTTEAPVTTTSLPETTTTTEPPPPPPPTAEQIGQLQFVLASLGFPVTDPPGEYGPGTRNAVMAFQKVHGLQRDGIAGPQTQAALAGAAPVEPRRGRHAHIEVDLAAQVAIVVEGDGRVSVLNATTGAAATATPPGDYSIFRQVEGWDPGPYGALYRPKYFTGGIAFHGGYPVLAAPASHGCVRLPDPMVDWLWASGAGKVGTEVNVY
jgi:lipoprotein-anchoring transpeptidase ErfK/SrfK